MEQDANKDFDEEVIALLECLPTKMSKLELNLRGYESNQIIQALRNSWKIWIKLNCFKSIKRQCSKKNINYKVKFYQINDSNSILGQLLNWRSKLKWSRSIWTQKVNECRFKNNTPTYCEEKAFRIYKF